MPVGAASTDGDGDTVTSAAATSIEDVNDDRLLYRHHGGGLLVASSTARPSCGWVPPSLPPLLHQSSDTFAGPYRVGPRLHSGPGCYTSAAAAAMFASRSGGYPGPPYGSGSELGGYGTGGWNVSVTQESYCHRAGAETSAQFPEAVGSTSTSAAVPLFVASPYEHGHHHHHHHIQHFHQQHQLQLQDDDVDDDAGEFEAESTRRVTLQSADENKDWIKYQPL